MGVFKHGLTRNASSEVLQLQRLISRDKLTEEAATQRIRAQMPLGDKVARADVVLDNSTTVGQLETQVKNLIQRIRPSPIVWLLEYTIPPALLIASIVAAKMCLPRVLLPLGNWVAERRAILG